jgi:propanol-preferring alcohol dehydrogenase
MPTPAPGQILVKTEACGVCHTDLHAAHGEAAAPIICAGVTTYKGIKETQAKPGQWIAISGVGGLGHLAIQYAKAMGLRVAAIDVDDGKLTHARSLGADLVINAKNGDPVAALRKETGGAHGVLITAPSLGAFRQGIAMTRKRGTCVLVGLPPGEFPIPLFNVVLNRITIRGSLVGTRQDMVEALAFAAEGKVKADIELQPLSAINTALERLEHGKVRPRVVLEFARV